jgi:hypothetical protein
MGLRGLARRQAAKKTQLTHDDVFAHRGAQARCDAFCHVPEGRSMVPSYQLGSRLLLTLGVSWHGRPGRLSGLPHLFPHVSVRRDGGAGAPWGLRPPSPASGIRVPRSAAQNCHSLTSTNTVPITREDPGSWEKKAHHGAPDAPGSPDPPACPDPGRITGHFGTISHSSRRSDGHRRPDDQPPDRLAAGRITMAHSPGGRGDTASATTGRIEPHRLTPEPETTT